MQIRDILNLSDDDIDNMSAEQLEPYIKQATVWAKERRRRALKAIEENPNMPIPHAYAEWRGSTSATWKQKLGISNYQSWKDVDFDSVGTTPQQKLKILSRFLETKTSTKEGQQAYLSDFRQRLGGRARNTKITEDMFNEFWRIVNVALETLTKATPYQYTKTIGERKVVMATNELQRMVFDEMVRDKFKEDYDPNLTFQDDDYANRILNKIAQKITGDYERLELEQKRKEEEDMAKKPQVTIRGLPSF